MSPVATPLKNAGDPSISTPLMRRPLRLLILDDEPLVRRMWCRLAERDDRVELVAVGTAAEVWEWIGARRFDLVVCDWRLGDDETCEALAAALIARGLAVAIVSGDVPSAQRAFGDSLLVLAKCPELLDRLVHALEHRPTEERSSVPPP